MAYGPLEKITDYLWELPTSYKHGMRVPGRVYASEKMLENIVGDNALDQVANVAFLPGIAKHSLAMPDIHWGYGFPIGGVAATVVEEQGVISPGGVGYDINCGVRLMRTNLVKEEITPKIREIVAQLFRDVPCGLGEGSGLRLSEGDERNVLSKGARWAIEQSFGSAADLDHIEEQGCLTAADSSGISRKAIERGAKQLGSLGSGNHFLEIQVVDEVFEGGQVLDLLHG